MMFPLNVELAPSVAAAPRQKFTFPHSAPPVKDTTLAAALVSAAGLENT
jgi:hypothetical protein